VVLADSHVALDRPADRIGGDVDAITTSQAEPAA
jgi:hypothetical protein